MVVFNIKVISDAVCPFCYIGKRRLEKAIAQYTKTMPGAAGDRFSVSWHPFYLDPSAPKTGIPLPERLAAKFGPERAKAASAHIKQVGLTEGINFSQDSLVGNTRDAHRLIELAKTKDAAAGGDANVHQDAVVNSLFKYYFEESGDITSHDGLITAAARGGLDAGEARAWLDDGADRGGPQVDFAVTQAFERGIHGVPHFTINDSVEISGAQDPEAFIASFLKAKEKAK